MVSEATLEAVAASKNHTIPSKMMVKRKDLVVKNSLMDLLQTLKDKSKVLLEVIVLDMEDMQ